MITAIIGHDHFLVWSLPSRTAQALAPGLVPWTENGHGFLLFAAAEFRHWRCHGLPGLGRLRVAGWLIPCQVPSNRIGNAVIKRFIDHALLPLGRTRVRIDSTGVVMAGVAAGHRLSGPTRDPLAWFDRDRCGLMPSRRGWRRWPLAKCDWAWTVHPASLHSTWAESLDARPLGMITVAPTLSIWATARPIATLTRQAP